MMRNAYVILIISIMGLISCKPKSSLEIKTNDTKSNNGFNMPDVGDVKNNSNNSSSNWSKDYRNKFVQGCITKASEKVSASEAYSYCNCMTEKVEAKYPDEKTVDASLTSADIDAMKVGCNSSSNQSNNQSNNNNNSSNNNNSNNSNTQASWSVSDQNEFMDNCAPSLAKTWNSTTKANNYCNCMLQKLMQEYPNSKDAGNVSKSHMTELATDCLR